MFKNINSVKKCFRVDVLKSLVNINYIKKSGNAPKASILN